MEQFDLLKSAQDRIDASVYKNYFKVVEGPNGLIMRRTTSDLRLINRMKAYPDQIRLLAFSIFALESNLKQEGSQ